MIGEVPRGTKTPILRSVTAGPRPGKCTPRVNELPKNWNATPDELVAHYACDDLAFAHDDVYFRAIDIEAPAPLVFRWLCQMRVAPYSYDLLDNFARRSPPRLIRGLDDLQPGQRIMHIFRLMSFERDVQMTIAQDSRSPMHALGDFAGTYFVRPYETANVARARTRLVAKIMARVRFGAPFRAVFPWLDLVMFRKQFFTLKAHCERDAIAG